jgi:hypothetical protein
VRVACCRAWLEVSLIVFVAGLALAACCTLGNPLSSRPRSEGAASQKALISANFPGVDLRSDPRAVVAFRSGIRDAISAAWVGYDDKDDTAILQACFDSGARVVLVPAVDGPWITRPLSVGSHTTVIFQEGTQVLARKGAFQGGDDSLVSLNDARDVTITGYGARLLMRKSDYRKGPYRESQWRHGIEMSGCTDVSVLGLTVESSGGDGVYLGRGKQPFNKNVTLRDLVLRDNYRQGISVICAEDLLVENVEMSGTEGTLPSAGIDFEPNFSDERIVRCVLQNCLIRSNAGPGILVNLQKLAKDSGPIDISVRDSVVSNLPFALMLVRARGARGTVQLLRTTTCGLEIVGLGSGVTLVRN